MSLSKTLNVPAYESVLKHLSFNLGILEKKKLTSIDKRINTLILIQPSTKNKRNICSKHIKKLICTPKQHFLPFLKL